MRSLRSAVLANKLGMGRLIVRVFGSLTSENARTLLVDFAIASGGGAGIAVLSTGATVFFSEVVTSDAAFGLGFVALGAAPGPGLAGFIAPGRSIVNLTQYRIRENIRSFFII